MASSEAHVGALEAPEVKGSAPAVALDGLLLGKSAGGADGRSGEESEGRSPAIGQCSGVEGEADALTIADSCSTGEGPLLHACAESTFSSRGEEPAEPSELEFAGSTADAAASEDATSRPAAQPAFPPGNHKKANRGGLLWQMLPPPSRGTLAALPSPGEIVLRDMLGAMDMQMIMLREPQQRLVEAVNYACQKALGGNFARLVLVGSAALSAGTPGSDVDVVCVTQRDGEAAPGSFCGFHTKVHQALLKWAKDSPAAAALVSVEMIDEARVPILRLALGGPPGSMGAVVVDVSFDQQGPIDHVEWFRRSGVVPAEEVTHSPFSPAPLATQLATSMLRCIKWWLRLRQIPRNKEGGLPTMAWLLMAAHMFLSDEGRRQVAADLTLRPTAALLELLRSFFMLYSSPDGLNSILSFSADAEGHTSSKLTPRARRSSPWGEFKVRDPTREGKETTLTPRLLPATQLLLAVELGRAAERLSAEVEARSSGCWDEGAIFGCAESIAGLFSPRPEGANSLPARVEGGMGAIVLLGDPGRDLGRLEVVMIENAKPRDGWRAPFLHRADERSVIHVRLCDVEEHTGKCKPRRRDCETCLVLGPCHFVCGVAIDHRAKRWCLEPEDLELYERMQSLLEEMEVRHQERMQQGEDQDAAEDSECADEEPATESLRRDRAMVRAAQRARNPGRGKKNVSSAACRH